jgi:hypothetical protein
MFAICNSWYKFHLLHRVRFGTNSLADSVVVVVSPMLMYSFTKDESLQHDLYTFLTKSAHVCLVNMKIIKFEYIKYCLTQPCFINIKIV